MKRAAFLLVALCLLACTKAEPGSEPIAPKRRATPRPLFADAPPSADAGAVPVNVMRESTGWGDLTETKWGGRWTIFEDRPRNVVCYVLRQTYVSCVYVPPPLTPTAPRA